MSIIFSISGIAMCEKCLGEALKMDSHDSTEILVHIKDSMKNNAWLNHLHHHPGVLSLSMIWVVEGSVVWCEIFHMQTAWCDLDDFGPGFIPLNQEMSSSERYAAVSWYKCLYAYINHKQEGKSTSKHNHSLQDLLEEGDFHSFS